MKIVIIDYGMGNLLSVFRKCNKYGVKPIISSDLNQISNAEKLILPGVGHFSSAINNLQQSGIWDILNRKVLYEKTPILGICLGMQIMAKFSEEAESIEGLGWFDADVVKFQVRDKLKYKVPHMGWNSISLKHESKLFQNVPHNAMFYFVHSYHLRCNRPKDILTETVYDYKFTSSIIKNNIYGIQFHPEKSYNWGGIIIQNFINL